jgi:hypothetical protein
MKIPQDQHPWPIGPWATIALVIAARKAAGSGRSPGRGKGIPVQRKGCRRAPSLQRTGLAGPWAAGLPADAEGNPLPQRKAATRAQVRSSEAARKGRRQGPPATGSPVPGLCASTSGAERPSCRRCRPSLRRPPDHLPRRGAVHQNRRRRAKPQPFIAPVRGIPGQMPTLGRAPAGCRQKVGLRRCPVSHRPRPATSRRVHPTGRPGALRRTAPAAVAARPAAGGRPAGPAIRQG